MKITSVSVLPLGIPSNKPVKLAYGTLNIGAHILVKIETDEGIAGYGETSPTRRWYPETQETVTVVLKEYLAPLLIGKDPFRIGQIISEMDSQVQEGWCAKAAVDIALHDLVGKALGTPVYQLLGGSFRDELSTLELDLSIQSPEETAKAAAEGVKSGVSSFEIKMGLEPLIDVERVRAVREAVGNKARLRVDINEGYNIAVAKQTLSKMEQFGLEYIEQPLPAWNLHGMAELADKLNTPICADQSAYTPNDVASVIKMGAADYVCIKIGRSGFWKAKNIAMMCEAFGIPCTLGSMLPLGPGARAIHHFTKATKNIAVAVCGVYGSPLDYYKTDIVRDPIEIGDGLVHVPDAPGLGIEIDEKIVQKYKLT